MGKKENANYPFLNSREGVWKEIVRYVHRDCGSVSSLLELGAGYCNFVNQYPAKKKCCVEQNALMADYANEDVDFRCSDALTALDAFEVNSFDLVFASNFLEHLTETEHGILLPKIHHVLSKTGKLVLLQPNYNRCKKNYFDDKTHRTIFSNTNIDEFLEKFNFKRITLRSGVLPFSMKSKLPKFSFLVWLYLLSPIKPKAAQMYVVAKKR